MNIHIKLYDYYLVSSRLYGLFLRWLCMAFFRHIVPLTFFSVYDSNESIYSEVEYSFSSRCVLNLIYSVLIMRICETWKLNSIITSNKGKRKNTYTYGLFLVMSLANHYHDFILAKNTFQTTLWVWLFNDHKWKRICLKLFIE